MNFTLVRIRSLVMRSELVILVGCFLCNSYCWRLVLTVEIEDLVMCPGASYFTFSLFVSVPILFYQRNRELGSIKINIYKLCQPLTVTIMSCNKQPHYLNDIKQKAFAKFLCLWSSSDPDWAHI